MKLTNLDYSSDFKKFEDAIQELLYSRNDCLNTDGCVSDFLFISNLVEEKAGLYLE